MMENCENELKWDFFPHNSMHGMLLYCKLGVALKKTHANRKPLDLQYSEWFINRLVDNIQQSKKLINTRFVLIP